MSVRAAVTSKIGVALMGLALLGGGSAAAAVSSAPEPRVADVVPAVPQEAPQPQIVEAPVVDAPVVEVPAPVAVPEPAPVVEEPAVAPAPVKASDIVPDVPKQPSGPDPSIGTTDKNGRYTPAVVPPKPGEPAVVPGGGMTPATPLLGDDPQVVPVGG